MHEPRRNFSALWSKMTAKSATRSRGPKTGRIGTQVHADAQHPSGAQTICAAYVKHAPRVRSGPSVQLLCAGRITVWEDYVSASTAERSSHPQSVAQEVCDLLQPAPPVPQSGPAALADEHMDELTDMPSTSSMPAKSGPIASPPSLQNRHAIDAGSSSLGGSTEVAPGTTLEDSSSQLTPKPSPLLPRANALSNMFTHALRPGSRLREAALVARTRKRYSEAVEHYSAAIELRLLTCQYKATLYNERALTNYHLGHHLEVIWDCHMSLALNPPALLPMCIRGRSFTELGYFSHALVDLLPSGDGMATLRELFCEVDDKYTRLGRADSPDHHKVLGVPPSATPAEITRAYRQLVLSFHPDRAVGQAARSCAEVVFPLISAAFAALSAQHVLVAQSFDEAGVSAPPATSSTADSQCSTQHSSEDSVKLSTVFAALGHALTGLVKQSLGGLWKQATYGVAKMSRIARTML